jgi:hypothetical protein
MIGRTVDSIKYTKADDSKFKICEYVIIIVIIQSNFYLFACLHNSSKAIIITIIINAGPYMYKA